MCVGFLVFIVCKYGILILWYVWFELVIIGCWFGGSVGIQVEIMWSFFSFILLICDLGFRVMEGIMMILLLDYFVFGVLVLYVNFYEFIVEDDIDEENL